MRGPDHSAPGGRCVRGERLCGRRCIDFFQYGQTGVIRCQGLFPLSCVGVGRLPHLRCVRPPGDQMRVYRHPRDVSCIRHPRWGVFRCCCDYVLICVGCGSVCTVVIVIVQGGFVAFRGICPCVLCGSPLLFG